MKYSIFIFVRNINLIRNMIPKILLRKNRDNILFFLEFKYSSMIFIHNPLHYWLVYVQRILRKGLRNPIS